MSHSVFVMTDVVGSTALWEAHGPLMADALKLHDDLVHPSMTASGGRVFKHTGDGMIAAFEDADAAVAAARDAIGALNEADWGATGPLVVRTSIHAGSALERDGDFFGSPINKLARINGVGHPSQILISDTAQQLRSTSDGIDLGEHQLRDLALPTRLWQLDGAAHPPLGSMVAARHNLPNQITNFVGREAELAEVSDLVRQKRLVTISGVGGCGKTRMALEVAATVASAFSGGVWLVELTSERSEDRIGPRIIEALELGAVPPDVDATIGALTEATAGQPTLLVLDNCEHLIDGVADYAEQLLARVDNISVLATSREALSVNGEHAWRIPSLKDASVELFLERAVAAGAVDIEHHVDEIHGICESLDHIPLAIELAAAQAAHLAPADLAERLDDRFTLLGGGRRARRQRQQTLQAMMDWSYDLLAEDERQLLAELSIFNGTFSLAGATAVATGSTVVDLLGSLVAQSLVAGTSRDGRYRLLETVRIYALDKLIDSGDAEATRQRHLEWVQTFASARHMLPPAEYRDLSRVARTLLTERASYFDALEWAESQGDTDALADLVYGGWSVFVTERTAEAHRLVKQIARPRETDRNRYVAHLNAECGISWSAGDIEGTLRLASEVVAIVEAADPDDGPFPSVTGTSMYLLGVIACHSGDADGARRIAKLISTMGPLADPTEVTYWHNLLELDINLRFDGPAEESLRRIREVLHEQVPTLIPLVEWYTARLEMRAGRFDQALAAMEAADTPDLVADGRAQLPEMRACIFARMGRVHEAIGIIRADQGPMLDAHRQLANGGTMTVLVEFYTVAGDTERAQFWMRAVRDIDLPHSIQFRQPRFAELVGSVAAYLALPPSELIDEHPTEIQRLIVEDLDDIEARLGATAR